MTPLVVENDPPVTFLRRKMTGGRFSMGVVIRRYTDCSGGCSEYRPVMHLQEVQRATYLAHEYNVPLSWGIGQGGHFCLMIDPKNANLVEDIDILLLVKFRWIPSSSFRG